MTVLLTPRLPVYTGLAATGMLAGLLLGNPEAALLGVAFLAVVAAGLAVARVPQAEAVLSLDRDRAVEGDEIQLSLRIRSGTAVRGLDVELRTPSELAVLDAPALTGISLKPGEEREIEVRLRCRRWGGHLIGGAVLRDHDPLRLFRYERATVQPLAVRVFPGADRLRAVIRPLETQAFAGDEVSRARGDGIEFAEVRPFAAGDRVRQVNWGVTARRGELHVNQQHPERNSDVILFVDSFLGSGEAADGLLDLAIRGAAALAARYLQRRDRVGVVGFGGILRWLRPGMGGRHLYRLLESLADTQVVLSYAWKAIDVIPPGVLPAKALLVALTPLFDERSVTALVDARGRGFDVAVVELDVLPFLRPARGELGELALRVWTLRRQMTRERFEAEGVPVVVWDGRRPLDAALEEVRRFRRQPLLRQA